MLAGWKEINKWCWSTLRLEKEGHLEEATGENGYGNVRNQTYRTEKPPEVVILRRNAVIGGLWPGRRSQGSKCFPSHCPFHPSLSRLVCPFGQTHLESRGSGCPLMEICKSRVENILTIPQKALCNKYLKMFNIIRDTLVNSNWDEQLWWSSKIMVCFLMVTYFIIYVSCLFHN